MPLNQKNFKVLWAGLSVFLFSLIFLASVVIFCVNNILLNTDEYKKALDEMNLYNELPHLIIKQMVLPFVGGKEEKQQEFLGLHLSNWEQLISSILPPEDFEFILNDVLDKIDLYFDGQLDQVVISLVGIKAQISGAEGVEAVTSLISSLPVCNEDQLASIVLNLGFGELNFELCRPPDEVIEFLDPYLSDILLALSEYIPDQILILPPPETLTSGLLTKPRIFWLRRSMDISPLFPIFPLFIISFYVVQSKRSLLLWWGISLLVSGSFVILLGIMGKFVGIDYLLAEYWVQGLPSQFSTWIAPFLEKVWGAVLETCTNKVLYIGILTMLFGTCLMGIIKFRFLYHYWTGRNN